MVWGRSKRRENGYREREDVERAITDTLKLFPRPAYSPNIEFSLVAELLKKCENESMPNKHGFFDTALPCY